MTIIQSLCPMQHHAAHLLFAYIFCELGTAHDAHIAQRSSITQINYQQTISQLWIRIYYVNFTFHSIGPRLASDRFWALMASSEIWPKGRSRPKVATSHRVTPRLQRLSVGWRSWDSWPENFFSWLENFFFSHSGDSHRSGKVSPLTN